MAGKDLKFKLVLEADSKTFIANIKQSENAAKQALNAIKSGAASFSTESNKAAQSASSLGDQAKATANHVSVLEQSVSEANNELQQTKSAATQALGGINGLKTGFTALAGVLASLGVGLGVGELVKAADSYTNLSAQITIATQKGGDFESAMAGVHQVALATNSTLDATASLFTRMAAVGKEVGYSQEQALKLTQTITQAIQVGGGSAEAAEGAVIQFIQAMQGGVLRGEEFNSIMEGGIGLADALARGLGVTTGELRKMAENGELSSERVVKALSSQSESVQELYNKFPTTIGNALQRIATQWQILIGEMDQANGASATVAQWLVTLADSMSVVEELLADIGQGVMWVSDQFQKIDVATIEALKVALYTSYEAIKSLVESLGSIFGSVTTVLNTALSAIFDFNSGIDTANDKTNGFTKTLQAASVLAALFNDGFKGIAITVNLFAGAMYEATGAFMYWKSKFMLGDAKEAAFKEFQDLTAKAKELYHQADELALNHEVQVTKALDSIGQTRQEKTEEAKLLSKSQLDQLLLDQQTEVDQKKATEQEKIAAVQAYAEAAIAANNGAMDGVMQADLLTKGYIVTLGDAGNVSVKAWSQNEDAIESSITATDRARKAAVGLELDLDNALGRVSSKFMETSKHVDNLGNDVEGLGVQGEEAADVIYKGWVKWLETAKNQTELEYAEQKLKDFGATGKLSTQQIEQGLHAIKIVAQQLPADLDPVEQAFERLGIKTKEQLRLAAQIALADFETVRSSGQATADQLQQAYERVVQAAAASGDAAVIANANAKASSLGLKVQVDETGKTSVTSMNEVEKAVERVGRSFGGLQGHARDAGKVMREEAKSSTEAWNDMLSAMSGSMHETPTGSRAKMAYDQSAIMEKLKAQGYDDKRAEQLAKEIYQSSVSANGSRYKNVSGSNSWSFSGGGGGMSNVDYVDQQIARYAQYAGNQTVSTGSSASTAKNVNYQIQFGGQTLSLQGDAGQEGLLNQLVSQLQAQAKST